MSKGTNRQEARRIAKGHTKGYIKGLNKALEIIQNRQDNVTSQYEEDDDFVSSQKAESERGMAAKVYMDIEEELDRFKVIAESHFGEDFSND